MLFDALFGNPNIEKVLLFLFVNEKCYATQLSRCLGGALTPIQHALERLEKGQIIASHLEGKTRLFRFNPHYPFLRELQALLKLGYQNLTLHDQHAYYCPQSYLQPKYKRKFQTPSSASGLAEQEALSSLWQRLLQVKHLSFSALSKSENASGWNRTGKAKVNAECLASHQLMFQEQGNWVSSEGKPFDFKNVFRWTWQASQPSMTLEHLRHGPEHPVVLFELAPVSYKHFETVQPFICRQDTYLAYLYCDRHLIQLHWRILGPRKNEEMHYIYT